MEDPYGNGYLYGNGFIPTIFSKFKNLEKLILFRLCYCFMQNELEEQLAITAFPKLKVLHIQDASIYTVKKMIEKTEGNEDIIERCEDIDPSKIGSIAKSDKCTI